MANSTWWDDTQEWTPSGWDRGDRRWGPYQPARRQGAQPRVLGGISRAEGMHRLVPRPEGQINKGHVHCVVTTMFIGQGYG